VSVEKFLKQRAVKIAVGGQYTPANWYDRHGRPRTFACRTTRVSPFRMMVDVPVVGKVGDPITSYFSDFGKLEGFISDTMSGAFLLELEMTRPMREKLASKLTWLEKKQKNPSILDVRKDARIIPASPHSTLTLADGSTHGCFVVDMSVSGAAVSAEVQPPIGNAPGRRNLHRPRRQTFARWLRRQVRRTAEPPRSQPACHPVRTAAFRRRCKGRAPRRRPARCRLNASHAWDAGRTS
jgi:hypothetical protein